MSWADHAKKTLSEGKAARIQPRGNSMQPKVNSGDVVDLEPAKDLEIKKDDIVLVRVSGRDYLHLVKAVDGKRYQIGNNRGGVNGWVGKDAILGRATKIAKPEPKKKKKWTRTQASSAPASSRRRRA